MQDLFGEEVAPPEPRRATRQHTPAQGGLVLYETLGATALPALKMVDGRIGCPKCGGRDTSIVSETDAETIWECDSLYVKGGIAGETLFLPGEQRKSRCGYTWRVPAPLATKEPPPPGPAERHPHRAPSVRASATSEAAAAALDPRTLNAKREEVLRLLCGTFAGSAMVGLTDNELIEILVKSRNWNANTPRARRVELVRDGWLQDSGRRHLRSVVWEPTPAAREWFASLVPR